MGARVRQIERSIRRTLHTLPADPQPIAMSSPSEPDHNSLAIAQRTRADHSIAKPAPHIRRAMSPPRDLQPSIPFRVAFYAVVTLCVCTLLIGSAQAAPDRRRSTKTTSAAAVAEPSAWGGSSPPFVASNTVYGLRTTTTPKPLKSKKGGSSTNHSQRRKNDDAEHVSPMPMTYLLVSNGWGPMGK